MLDPSLMRNALQKTLRPATGDSLGQLGKTSVHEERSVALCSVVT
jgi:hypothetical protein